MLKRPELSRKEIKKKNHRRRMKTHLGAIPGLKILKKGVQIGQKLKRGPGTQEGHLTLLECRSAHEKCRLAHGKCRLAPIFDLAWGFPD